MKILALEQRDPAVTPLDKFIHKTFPRGSSYSTVRNVTAADLRGKDVFIFPCWMVGRIDIVGERAQAIMDFVKRGGICWIMNQRQIGWYGFLPEALRPKQLLYRYVETIGPLGAKIYVCPWILERNHPVFNRKHFIDESDFVFWNIKAGRENFRSAATHPVYLSKDWKTLAGYQDYEIKLKDGARLIAEARYGKGLYLWNQTFSPEITFADEKEFSLKFTENVLHYCDDFRKQKVSSAKIEPSRWALKSGERISFAIKTTIKNPHVDIDVTGPDGKKATIFRSRWTGRSADRHYDNKSVAAERDDHLKTAEALRNTCARQMQYLPQIGGTYCVEATVRNRVGQEARARTFFKCTKKNTPFKFLTHTHFMSDCTPLHLGVLYGACRRLNIDGVVLATGLFYGEEKLYTGPEDIKRMDNPAVRFFVGEEIHSMHNYSIAEGGAKQPDNRRHVITMGCATYPYPNERWIPENLARVHRKRGIAIVAHPGAQEWWMQAQNGHHFEAIEFDRAKPETWDKALGQGIFLTGVSGVDNLGPCQIFFPTSPNTGWFDLPFDQEGLIDTILRGKVTKIMMHPFPYDVYDVRDIYASLESACLRGRNNSIRFDINGQPVGGTVYAVGRIQLHLDIKSSFVLKDVKMVRNGDRNYLKVGRGKRIRMCKSEPVHGDAYYRVEDASNPPKSYGGAMNFTNPVFVKKVAGPPNGIFFFQNEAPYRFDGRQGRFVAGLTELRNVQWKDRVWEIVFYEPGAGNLFLSAGARKVEMDGKKAEYARENGMVKIGFGRGEHCVRAFFNDKEIQSS